MTSPRRAEAPPGEPDAAWRVSLRAAEIEAGPGSLSRLGDLAVELGGRRVLLVSDPGLEAAGHVARACDSLVHAGVQFELFVGVEENPTEACVERGLAAARRLEPDLLVALGGGSVMDATKGVNFLLTNGGRMEDYWGFGKAKRPMLPSIGVPCTAGTGSEAQSFALISRNVDHVKMACGDAKARFTRVLLDPEVLETVPRDVAAITGMDALSHAVESFATRTRHPISTAFAAAAWRLLDAAFPPLMRSNPGHDAREQMLAGAYLAGAAIETSMLGLAHALANPLTARHGVTHGIAVGLVLPNVVRFNGELCEPIYRQLVSVSPGESAAEALALRLEELRALAGLPETLEAAGVAEAEIDALATAAAAQWTAAHNPRPAEPAQLSELYRRSLEAKEAIA
ncbi:MAG: iron-containing alcohol dehydrogenase [Acidobacteria bacterium]|nr:MAG: iron-containing alcohol dehydrogenase [Acidobacteriota bacterium]